MARSQSVNFASITRVLYNGTELNRVNLNGNRRWERVWVPSTRQEYVSQGYWVDPAPYYETRTRRGDYINSGYWDPNQTDGDGFLWYDAYQTPMTWVIGYDGPWGGETVWTQIGSVGPTGDWWAYDAYAEETYQVLIDPPPYWVDTSYYRTVDNSYWAYYY